MRIKIVYKDNNCIDIQLNNRPAVAKWFEHCNEKYKKYGYRSNLNLSAIQFDKDEKQIESTNPDNKRVEDVYQVMVDTANEIKNDGHTLSFVLPDQFTYDQTILNNVHRYYTDNAVLTKTDTEFFKLISTLNYCVHELEDLTKNTSNKDFISELNLSNLWLTINRYPIPMDCWLEFDEVGKKENYNFFNYDHDYTVRLDRSILGKCVLQSFEDDDDPQAKECTGRLGSFGGFFIEETTNLKKLYQSSRFENWCAKYKTTPEELPLEFVIGHVSHSDLPLADYSKKDLKSLEFIV